MTKKDIVTRTFAEAFKTALPIITGVIPTGVAYALVARNAGISPAGVILSSLIVFAGSVQFISIELIRQGVWYLQFALVIFLLQARHMFFGISLFEKFNKTGKMKPLMIFWLTDESYAVMTGGGQLPKHTSEGLYYIFLQAVIYASWNAGTVLGVFASELLSFNTAGMDFALTATFLVIVTEQLKGGGSKLPFAVGGISALLSLLVLGPRSMLLGCCAVSVAALLLLRGHIEAKERGEAL